MNEPLYFNPITQRTAAEVGGWEHLDQLGVAVGVVIQGCRLRVFSGVQVSELPATLGNAPLVVGYNIRRFDFPALAGHTGASLENVRVLDLMEQIETIAGIRVGLDAVLSATLAIVRENDGLDLVNASQRGEMPRVIEGCEGCCNDVLAIKAIHEYGLLTQTVSIQTPDGEKCFPIRW